MTQLVMDLPSPPESETYASATEAREYVHTLEAELGSTADYILCNALNYAEDLPRGYERQRLQYAVDEALETLRTLYRQVGKVTAACEAVERNEAAIKEAV